MRVLSLSPIRFIEGMGSIILIDARSLPPRPLELNARCEQYFYVDPSISSRRSGRFHPTRHLVSSNRRRGGKLFSWPYRLRWTLGISFHPDSDESTVFLSKVDDDDLEISTAGN